ncbi:MAG: hypothetical protein IPI48_03385 [bacterium]|nr:hypothetical protein [bacterium]
METRRLLRVWLIIAALLVTAGNALPATVSNVPDGAGKVAVIDGHVVHNAGLVGHHVTNWGLLGSAPGVTSSYSDAPSAMWPIGSGNEYLWAAGLWVGAHVGGQPRVTAGAFGSEFLPTGAAADTIYRAEAGAVGGNRFPWSDADDDGDGREDEELPNGLDDDGDGLVDEDFAAFGDQQFVSAYNDLEPALQEQFPDHTPLGINIVQRSIQWGGPLSEDFIGYDFTITNVGAELLEQVPGAVLRQRHRPARAAGDFGQRLCRLRVDDGDGLGRIRGPGAHRLHVRRPVQQPFGRLCRLGPLRPQHRPCRRDSSCRSRCLRLPVHDGQCVVRTGW